MSASPADQLLFTYGTLQDAEVQLDTFGRLLAGTADMLPGYTIDYVDIADPRTADVSGHSVHPVLRATGNVLDKVAGTVVHLTADELDAADEYEVSVHRRVRARLSSGHDAWVYVS